MYMYMYRVGLQHSRCNTSYVTFTVLLWLRACLPRVVFAARHLRAPPTLSRIPASIRLPSQKQITSEQWYYNDYGYHTESIIAQQSHVHNNGITIRCCCNLFSASALSLLNCPSSSEILKILIKIRAQHYTWDDEEQTTECHSGTPALKLLKWWEV